MTQNPSVYNDWIIKQLLNSNIMLKNILKLNGAQLLSKNEQKSINGAGGRYLCNDTLPAVVCRSKSACQQNPDGSWYCA